MIKKAKQESLAQTLYKSICRKGQYEISQDSLKAAIFGIMGLGLSSDPHGNFCEYNKRFKVFYTNKMSNATQTPCSQNMIEEKHKKMVKIICDEYEGVPNLTDILTVIKKMENTKEKKCETSRQFNDLYNHIYKPISNNKKITQ